jgi:hypothetical protein
MGEWWTYAPSDFLLFSRAVYERQFALLNLAVWPGQALTMGVAAIVMILQSMGGRRAATTAGLLAALLWLSVASLYFAGRHAQINFIAPAMAAGFTLQAVAVAAVAVIAPQRLAGARPAGAALAVLALFAFPLLALLQGRPFIEAEIVGLAPDPTAAFTLGVLASAVRPAFFLAIIPLGWFGFSTLALWTMGSPSWGATSAAAILGAVALGMGRQESGAVSRRLKR